MRLVCHPHGHVLNIFFISAKSYDITNIFVTSILVQKIAYTSIYDIIMSPDHFEIKNKILRSLKRLN